MIKWILVGIAGALLVRFLMRRDEPVQTVAQANDNDPEESDDDPEDADDTGDDEPDSGEPPPRVGQTGGRLPGHARLVVIDKRVRAKTAEEKREAMWSWPRKRDFSKAEAKRRFARGFRGGPVEVRRLDTDPDQLKRLGLPIWRSEDDVAGALGISLGRLQFYARDQLDDGTCHYVRYRIPKASGGSRVILAPKAELKGLQRQVLDLLCARLPVSDAAHGFRRGRSIRTNAEPHVGKRFVIGLDLADFFPSVTLPRVRGLLIAYGYAWPVATSLALLCTEAERQPVELPDGLVHVPIGSRHTPQGAPTSPAIANAIARKLDHRLLGLARKHGWRYTRYADDLTFSGDDPAAIGPILALTKTIVADEGFALNPKKTRVMHAGQQQRVCGVVVNEVLGLSRKARRKIRAMLHQHGLSEQPDADRADEIAGKLAFVRMLNPAQADALQKTNEPTA